MTRYVVAVAAVVLVIAAGCGESTGRATDPGPGAPAGSGVGGVELVPEEQADLHLWVSNQSFADDPVAVTVTIDGVTVVDQPFAVEGQHNWELFPVALEPGRHTLSATSDTGVSLERTFRVPEGGPRYAVLDYWYYADSEGRHFSWRDQAEPVAFA